MDKQQLCDSLMTWLQTFRIAAPHSTVEELSDAVAMAEVLHQIAPEWFNDIWVLKIKKDCQYNWRLKVSNLKKILKGILEYYQEVIDQQIIDFILPDVNLIGEFNNAAELGRLLQLILGCAVNCDHKQEYIKSIMSMEESVQHVVMNAIQELMTKETSTISGENYPDMDQIKKLNEDLSNAIEAKTQVLQRCRELDAQVAQLMEEKANLMLENEKCMERLNNAESFEDMGTSSRKHQQLLNLVEQLQEETYRLEAAREDYRIKGELQEKEISDLQQKNSELSCSAEERMKLKDEIDVLRHRSDKVEKYEVVIESYKKKLDDLADLRRQVKILEDKNTDYMQRNMTLEEDLKKTQVLKTQLDVYKKQVQELHTKLSEETKKADKAEFETKRLQEKLQSVQREKERLIAERDSLKETNEELKGNQLQQEIPSNMGSLGNLSTTSESDFMETIPPGIKEKLIRLQHENRMLKLHKDASDEEQVHVLNSLLDDANVRTNELETEVRLSNQRIIELESQISDLQENQTLATSSNESHELRQKMHSQSESLWELESKFQKTSSQNEEYQQKLSEQESKLNQLLEMLSKKDEEMRSMEDRYKKHLEKAKIVIKSLDPKQNTGTTPEIQTLKNQLQEKDKLIQQLQREHDKSKTLREHEEKIIISAWYNLGMQLHRKATEDRLLTATPGQSFLSRQRQASTRRPQTISGSSGLGSSDFLDY